MIDIIKKVELWKYKKRLCETVLEHIVRKNSVAEVQHSCHHQLIIHLYNLYEKLVDQFLVKIMPLQFFYSEIWNGMAEDTFNYFVSTDLIDEHENHAGARISRYLLEKYICEIHYNFI